MKNISIKTRSVVFASIILILAATLISTINYIMSMNTTVDRLTISAQQTIKAWSPEIKTEDVEKLVRTQDPDIQNEMMAHFDKLSKYQPQVAQGYLFGVELANGTDTSVISAPTFLMNEFADSDLLIGSLYTQPQVIVESIKRMKKSEKQTMSIIYTDSYGTWITVLKPLFDKDGEMFAYYGIDFDASAYISAEYKKMATIFGIFILLIILIWLVQAVFSKNKNTSSKIKHPPYKEKIAIEVPTKSAKSTKLKTMPEPKPDFKMLDLQLASSFLNSDKLTTLREHSNHVNSAVYFITSIAKDSHRNLVAVSKDGEELLVAIDSSDTAIKLINRLIIEVQTATDKSVQSFQLDTLLNSSKQPTSLESQNTLKEITSQTRKILNNIEEMKDILQDIKEENNCLTTLAQSNVEKIETSEITSIIGNQQRLFKKLIQTSKNMNSIIHVLNLLTVTKDN